jgi:formylglycine-generating enzyme required for sulfatase activity
MRTFSLACMVLSLVSFGCKEHKRDPEYRIGGTVTGLVGSGLVLSCNGNEDLSISADGAFTFPTPLPDNSEYSITIKSQPSDSICEVTNGNGVISSADVTDISVEGIFTLIGENAQGYKEYRHNQTGIDFVRLPGGKFNMGSPDSEAGWRFYEVPVHEVTLSPFLIAKFEATQAQWTRVMGSNPAWFHPPGFPGDGSRPVETISWDDIQVFEAATGLTLPTEAQWEYACRAGTTGPFAGTGNLDDMGWYGNNTPDENTYPVGQKQPNHFGLYDMHGNVAEFCEDIYDEDFYSKPEAKGPDPLATAGSENRVVRGGHYVDGADSCRSAERYGIFGQWDRSMDIGFRLAYYPIP